MPKSPKIKLIIFDWDDVFTLGSKEGYFKCYHETLSELGIKLEPEEEKKRILAKWGRPHQEELKELLKEHPDLWEKSFKIYEEKLFGDAFIDCLSLVPGSNELLKRLKKEYILCVATGIHPKILKERVIPKFGVPEVFSQIISAYDIDDPEKAKPHPYVAQQILGKQKIEPGQAILVGDAEHDVLMARAAGIEPVVVLTGHLSGEEAKALGVKYIIEDVTRLEDVLKSL